MKPLLAVSDPLGETDVVWVGAAKSTAQQAAEAAAQGADTGRDQNDDALTISQMADKFGVTPRALRFYESKRLLKPAREGRGRVYSKTDQHHVSLILKGRKLGFTIAEIAQMIAAEEGEGSAQALKLTREKCVEQIAHLEQQLRETNEALAELRRMHIALCRS
ncbi:MAG TPA: MerR family transcriptional regulator [Xanthobacteraceae bacterium]|nr:MerR family transcriptional regulator [Xanthobacteraceae bacterium]